MGSRLLPGLAVAALCFASALWGQSGSFVAITPGSATMLVGESRPFRLVDQNGRAQPNVSWTISDPAALQVQKGDEIEITAKQPGNFRISARNANGEAEATINVVEGSSLPQGARKWSSPELEGCKVVQVTPAVPSASGVDVYAMTQCGDGNYLEAYTADGILVRRQKVSGGSGPAPTPKPLPGVPVPSESTQAPAKRLHLNSSSICDLVSVGTDEHKVRELLQQRKLSFRSDSSQGHAWLVEESDTQCKLWFDDKSVLAKKRKILVNE